MSRDMLYFIKNNIKWALFLLSHVFSVYQRLICLYIFFTVFISLLYKNTFIWIQTLLGQTRKTANSVMLFHMGQVDNTSNHSKYKLLAQLKNGFKKFWLMQRTYQLSWKMVEEKTSAHYAHEPRSIHHSQFYANITIGGLTRTFSLIFTEHGHLTGTFGLNADTSIFSHQTCIFFTEQGHSIGLNTDTNIF